MRAMRRFRRWRPQKVLIVILIGWTVFCIVSVRKVLRMFSDPEWKMAIPHVGIPQIAHHVVDELVEIDTDPKEEEVDDIQDHSDDASNSEILNPETTDSENMRSDAINNGMNASIALDQWLSINLPPNALNDGNSERCSAWNCQSAYNSTSDLWMDHRSTRWGPRHQSQNEELIALNQSCEYIFIGDSITERWDRAIFDVHFNNDSNGVVYGFSGDIIQDIGWRVKNGNGFYYMKQCLVQNETDSGSATKSMILLIGTNNLHFPHNATMRDYQSLMEQFDEFLKEINEEQNKQTVKLYVMAIFPRGNGKDSGDWNVENRYFYRIQYMNEYLRSFVNHQENENMHFVDCNDQLLVNVTTIEHHDDHGHSYQIRTGWIDKEIMPDRLHLSSKGYQRWAECLKANMVQ